VRASATRRRNAAVPHRRARRALAAYALTARRQIDNIALAPRNISINARVPPRIARRCISAVARAHDLVFAGAIVETCAARHHRVAAMRAQAYLNDIARIDHLALTALITTYARRSCRAAHKACARVPRHALASSGRGFIEGVNALANIGNIAQQSRIIAIKSAAWHMAAQHGAAHLYIDAAAQAAIFARAQKAERANAAA